MQTRGPYQAEEEGAAAAEEEESVSKTAEQEGEKRDLDLFEQSPGLISDTNRPTGKLCRAEREKLRRREG